MHENVLKIEQKQIVMSNCYNSFSSLDNYKESEHLIDVLPGICKHLGNFLHR